MVTNRISEDMLAALRLRVKSEVSYARYLHILGVERCAMQMAECFSDVLSREDVNTVRAAALLHDVTKDKGLTWYNDFIRTRKIDVPAGESVQLYHTLTAPEYIKENYSEFATEEILSAVYKHTTGDGEMNLIDKIICLADYIEDGRKNASCANVRSFYRDFDFAHSDTKKKENHLNTALLKAFRFTKDYILKKNEPLSLRTLTAIDGLVAKIGEYEKTHNTINV